MNSIMDPVCDSYSTMAQALTRYVPLRIIF